MPLHTQLSGCHILQLFLLFGDESLFKFGDGIWQPSFLLPVIAKLKQRMNEFEKRMSALRRQFSAERNQITKDAYRQIGHINNAISATSFPEVRDALRAEKARVYEAMRTSHRYNRICYMQQLEALEDEYNIHLEKNPSKTQLRRMMAAVCRFVESAGANSYTVAFGDNRRATVSFS